MPDRLLYARKQQSGTRDIQLRFLILFVCCALCGCDIVPAEGPLAKSISEESGLSPAELGRHNAAVFDVYDVDSKSARLVFDHVNNAFSKNFGIGDASPSVLIGVGDELGVTIFEAGADGLFSTTKSKQTTLDIIVQPDGTAPIPYAGSVKFRGLTIEQARQAIKSALIKKAVEPDVIVSSVSTSSRSVIVSGAVGHSAVIPLNLNGEKITDAIAQAGGPVGQDYETYITLIRGQRVGTMLLHSVIAHPDENIRVQSGDRIFLTADPRTFTILGSVTSNSRIKFGAADLNLVEAVALGGGAKDTATDASGFFVFRYEDPVIVESLLGERRFRTLLNKGMTKNGEGNYPIVYRFDMTHPDSLLVGQTFPIKSRDVIYVSRHPSVDLTKFLAIVGSPVGLLHRGASTADLVF